MSERTVVRLASAGLLVLGLVYVVYGRIHVDESYYLYATRAVTQGKVLYRDFFFLQNPALPYLYGLPMALAPSPYTGRALSLGFTLLSLAATVGIARRLGGEPGGAIAAVLLAFNGFHTYFGTMVRVYAAATALLTVAGWLYLRSRSRVTAAALAGVALGLAFDFRFTVAPAAVALLGMLLLKRQWRAAGALVAAGAATVAAAFAPFAAIDAQKLWFQLVGFHSEIRVMGGIPELALFKVKAFPRLANAYFLIWAGLVLLIASHVHAHGRALPWVLLRRLREQDSREADLWVVAIGTFLAQLVPMFVQASYFVLSIPLLAALLGGALARRLPSPLPRPAPAALLALGLLQGLAYGKSSLAPDGRLRGPFMRAQVGADYLRSVTREGDLVLTSDSQLLPFLAGREILHGYESFEYFPSWSREKCEHYGVVNDAMIHEQLRAGIPAAVLVNELSYLKPFPESVDWGPEARNAILEVLGERYVLGAVFPSAFTPGLNTYVHVRRDRLPEGARPVEPPKPMVGAIVDPES